MASYGLLDWDLTYWKQPTIFNLELMKLAAYHKQKRNMVKMLYEYDHVRYSKIIVRKDYEDDEYPTEIFNNPKSICGGMVFSNGIYQSMDIEIEKIIHDKNIVQIPNALKEIKQELLYYNSKGRRLGFKYPLNIYTDEEFTAWGKIKKLRNMHIMRLHKFFNDTLFYDIIMSEGNMECEYIIDELSNTILCEIVKQAIFLREHYSKILLTLRDENLVSPEWRKVLQLINSYTEYCFKNRENVTIYEYAKRFCKWLKVDIINTFNFVRENNYPLFKLFYECLTVEMHDGHFESRFEWKANGGTIYDKR